jgi:O-antigen ligase
MKKIKKRRNTKKNKLENSKLTNEIKKELEKKPVAKWEYLITIIGFFMSTYTLIPLLREMFGSKYNVSEGDTLMQSIWLFIYFVSIIAILFYRKYIFFNLLKDKALWAIIILIYFSIYWSQVADITFRRAVAITLTQIFGIYVGCTFSWKNILKIMQISFALSSILSLIFIIFLPGISIDPTFGDSFRGVYLHKNSLGIFMAVSTLIWIFSLYGSLVDKNKKSTIINLTFLSLSLCLLLLSRSKTSFLVMLVTLIAVTLVKSIFSKKYGLTVFSIISFTLLIFISFIGKNFEVILALLGKDATLTGRIPLWKMVWECFLEKPFFGFGYSGFWSIPQSGSYYISEVLFDSPNAHNGYIDILINIGIFGILFFLYSLQKNIFLSIELIHSKRNYLSLIPFALFTFFTIYNITESFLLVQNSFTWIIFVAMAYKLRIDLLTNNEPKLEFQKI